MLININLSIEKILYYTSYSYKYNDFSSYMDTKCMRMKKNNKTSDVGLYSQPTE